MQTPDRHDRTPQLNVAPGETRLIGIAVLAGNPISVIPEIILRNALQLEFRNNGITHWEEWTGVCIGPWLVQVIRLHDFARALRITEKSLEGLGVSKFSDFGYYDSSEDYWRSLPSDRAQVLNLLITEEGLVIAAARAKVFTESLEHSLAKLLNGEDPPQ